VDDFLKLSDPAQGSCATGGLVTPNFGRQSFHHEADTWSTDTWSDWDKRYPGGLFRATDNGKHKFESPKVSDLGCKFPNGDRHHPTDSECLRLDPR